MTLDDLAGAVAADLARLPRHHVLRLQHQVENRDLDEWCSCAAIALLGGEDHYESYARWQQVESGIARARLRAETDDPRLDLAGGPGIGGLVEILVERGEWVPDMWTVEAAYEGWCPSVEPDESARALEDLVRALNLEGVEIPDRVEPYRLTREEREARIRALRTGSEP